MPISVSASQATTTQMIPLTNFDRLKPLKENLLLMKAAQNRAQFFCDEPFSHTAEGLTPWSFFNAVGYKYQYAGENLAKGYATPIDAEIAFMNSPTHKANIVKPVYTDIGVGWACGITVVLFGTI